MHAKAKMYFVTFTIFFTVISFAYSLPLGTSTGVSTNTFQFGCEPGENTCSKCYDVLVNEIISSDRNRFNLQNAFFPPDLENPVFVAVTYYFTRNMSGDGTTNYSLTSPNQTWFWTQSTFYLFQPVLSLQYTSLLFADIALREAKVSLYLQPDCINASISMLKLLTQRLKLYAMQQKVLSPITDGYSAKGENLTTLEIFHKGHNSAIYKGESVTIYEFVFQIVFPLIVFVFLGGLLQHVFENDSKKFFKKIRAYFSSQDQGDDDPQDNVHDIYYITVSTKNMYIYMLVIGSITFVTYVIVLDCIAVNKRSYFVNDNIFFSPNNIDSNFGSLCVFTLEYLIPIFMLIYDLFIWIGAIATIFSFLCCNCCNKKWYHIVMAPFACIITHSYHILIGFIQSPHHAASILIFYAIILLVFFLTLKAAYYNLFQCLTHFDNCNPPNYEQQDNEKGTFKHVCNFLCCKRLPHLVVFFLMSLASVVLALIMVYIVYLFLLVPINMAIEDAPARLFNINQTVLVLIGAAITYKLYRNNKISSNIVEQLAKANKEYLKETVHYGVNTSKEWDDLETADKEVEMGKLMISALHKVHSPPQPPSPALATTQRFAQALTQALPIAKREAISTFLSNNLELTQCLVEALALVKTNAQALAADILSQVIKVEPARAQIQGLAVAPSQTQALNEAQSLALVQVHAQTLIDFLNTLQAQYAEVQQVPAGNVQAQDNPPQAQPQAQPPPQGEAQPPPQPPPAEALAVALTQVKQAAKNLVTVHHPPLPLTPIQAVFFNVLDQIQAQAQALANVLDPVQALEADSTAGLNDERARSRTF